MSFTLGDVIDAARDRSVAFHQAHITDRTFARFLSDAQNECIAEAQRRLKGFLVQSTSIVLALSADNAVGAVGAGTGGGLPGTVDDSGDVSVLGLPVGSLVEAAGATVLVASSVVSSATSTTLARTGAGWSVNAYVGQLVRIVHGTGAGQVRTIASNTTDTLTVSAWTTVPDTSSVFEIVESSPAADRDINVVTQVPATSSRSGFLVRLDASGVPYLDLTKPLVGTFDVGLPLPAHLAMLGGTVHYASTPRTAELQIQSYANRARPFGWPAVWVEGESLFLCGRAEDWTDVESIDVRFVPIAPSFTGRSDYFLLPDSAKAYMVAKAAAFAADRVQGVPGVVVDPTPLHARAQASADAFYQTLAARKAMRVSRVRESW